MDKINRIFIIMRITEESPVKIIQAIAVPIDK